MRKARIPGSTWHGVWLGARYAVGPAILVISILMFVRFSLLYARAIWLAETLRTS